VPATGISGVQAMIIEAVLTFFLASTVIQAAAYGKVGIFRGGAIVGLVHILIFPNVTSK